MWCTRRFYIWLCRCLFRKMCSKWCCVCTTLESGHGLNALLKIIWKMTSHRRHSAKTPTFKAGFCNDMIAQILTKKNKKIIMQKRPFFMPAQKYLKAIIHIFDMMAAYSTDLNMRSNYYMTKKANWFLAFYKNRHIWRFCFWSCPLDIAYILCI